MVAQTILSGADTTNLKGAEFCVGYGTSAHDMINNGNIRAVSAKDFNRFIFRDNWSGFQI